MLKLRIILDYSSGYLLRLGFKGGRQHVGEQLQRHRKEELHERDDDEHQERQQSENVCTRSEELRRIFQRIMSTKSEDDDSNKHKMML